VGFLKPPTDWEALIAVRLKGTRPWRRSSGSAGPMISNTFCRKTHKSHARARLHVSRHLLVYHTRFSGHKFAGPPLSAGPPRLFRMRFLRHDRSIIR